MKPADAFMLAFILALVGLGSCPCEPIEAQSRAIRASDAAGGVVRRHEPDAIVLSRALHAALVTLTAEVEEHIAANECGTGALRVAVDKVPT